MRRSFILIVLMTLLVSSAQAQMVGSTNNGSNRTTSNSLEKPKGHYLRLEAGFPNLFTVAYGYQINPWFMVGGGGGFGMITYYRSASYYYYNHHQLGLGSPLFAEVIFNTPKKKASFFVDYKVGVNIPYENYYYYYSYDDYSWKEGRAFYSSLNLGAGFGNFGVYGGISTNSADLWFSAGVSYNIPVKVH